MKRALGVMVAIVLAMATAANAVPLVWNVDAAGDWGLNTNWLPVGVPVANDNLVLGNIITAPRILTLSGPFTLNSLTVNNTNAGSLYTLSATVARTITFAGAGTKISVGALGANLGLSASPTFITYALPNTAGLIWDIGGPTYVGTVNGTSPLATLTKTGAGLLTWGGSGTYSGTLTVNAGNLRMTGSPTAMGNFLMTPTGAGDLTYDGTGWLGLAANKTARFLGTGLGNVIVSPGTAAGALVLQRIGTSGNSNTVTLDNNSKYNADVSGASIYSDTLGVFGSLNLGAAGTTNSLYITLASGSLQSAYILAGASTALTGKFNQVYYNNVLVANPETAGAIGGTNQLVYGAKSVILVNPATNRRNYWVNPDPAIIASNYFDVAGNWSRGAAPTSADNVFIGFSAATLAGNGNSRTVGSLRTEGTGYFNFGNNWTLTTKADNGGTGDFFWTDTTNRPSGTGFTLNVGGNLWIGTLYFTNDSLGTINLYGTNKAVHVDAYDAWSGYNGPASQNVQNIYGTYYDNGSTRQRYYVARNTVVVKPGGKILKRPDNVASTWAARRFVFEGGQSNLPALGDCVSFIYQPSNEDYTVANGNTGRLVITGGVTYPQDVTVGADYFTTNKWFSPQYYYEWYLKSGDVTVGRDFYLNETAGSSKLTGMFINMEENGTGASRKFTVGRHFYIQTTPGGDTNSSTGFLTEREPYGVRFKNSTVRVNDNLIIGADQYAGGQYWGRNTARIDLGNGTINVGNNFTVYRMTDNALAFWKNANKNATSRVVFDGAGTGKRQYVATWGFLDNVMFNSVAVNNPGGTVLLDNGLWNNRRIKGGLWLTGNLSIECGTFRQGNQPIVFDNQVGATFRNLVNPSTYVFDNVMLRPNAVLTLLSDISIQYSKTNVAFQDNLIMLAGSKLYLNGFTLKAEGHTWISDQVGSDGVPWDQGGTIYGTLSIPEPATLLLLGTGALGAVGWLRRRRMR